MQESIVFLVRVQCRRKESSRSLSHLLMSFLLNEATHWISKTKVKKVYGDPPTSPNLVEIDPPKPRTK